MSASTGKSVRLMRAAQRDRRRWMRGAAAAAGATVLSGCDRLSGNASFVEVLKSAEHLNRVAQKVVAPRAAMAQEFAAGKIAPIFRGNGTLSPRDPDYVALRGGGFADYTLTIGGLVERPLALTLAELRALPSRTQITRHDCVEGWSCIGQWTGVPLGTLLDRAGLKPGAAFVVFRCFDSMEGGAADSRYYESIDLDDAHHAQTILAYQLNGKPLPVANGAPLRCRVERQLGYKQAKYVRAIEVVDSLAGIRGGKGGYWEDEGYEWYAGI